MDESEKDSGERKSNFTQNVANAMRMLTSKLKSKAALNPLTIKIILITAVVLVVVFLLFICVSAVISMFTFDGFDRTKLTINSLDGITGNKFYGVRFLYKDDNQAIIDLKENYVAFTISLIDDVNSNASETITISENKSEKIEIIVTAFSNELAKNIDNNFTDGSLEDSLKIIDHFGFTTEEFKIVINSIADTIVTNNYSSLEKDIIQNKLNGQLNNSKYNEYKQVCDKLYVKDYILDSNSTLKDMAKENYVGIIYMPKENVTINSASFIFVVDQGYGTKTELKLYNNSNSTSVAPETQIDVTWYKNSSDFKTYDAENINTNLTKFNAINNANTKELEQETSIYKLLKNGSYSTYFKQIEGNLNVENLLNNINTENYLYFQCDSQYSFNWAEYSVEY